MNVLETEWWTLMLPPEWWAESEGDSILVGDRDEVGCIEISTLHRDEGDFEAAEILSIAESDAPGQIDWRTVTVGDFRGVNGSFREDGAALREWYVGNAGMLLFITYSCDEENGGMDDAAVDEILDTLQLLTRK